MFGDEYLAMADDVGVEEAAAVWFYEWPGVCCGGPVEPWGMLGRLAWGRCVDCGLDNWYDTRAEV